MQVGHHQGQLAPSMSWFIVYWRTWEPWWLFHHPPFRARNGSKDYRKNMESMNIIVTDRDIPCFVKVYIPYSSLSSFTRRQPASKLVGLSHILFLHSEVGKAVIGCLDILITSPYCKPAIDKSILPLPGEFVFLRYLVLHHKFSPILK